MRNIPQWMELTTDLTKWIPQLPDCYREGFEVWKKLEISKKTMRFASMLAQGVYVELGNIVRKPYLDVTSSIKPNALYYNGKIGREIIGSRDTGIAIEIGRVINSCRYDWQDKTLHESGYSLWGISKSDRNRYKKLPIHEYTDNSKAIADYHADDHDITILKENIKGQMSLWINQIVEHTDGTTYIFMWDKMETLPSKKSKLVEWWMVSDDIMILRYERQFAQLFNAITLWKNKDMFVTINTKEWKVIWAFKGKFKDQYIYHDWLLLPYFERHEALIETTESPKLLETLASTSIYEGNSELEKEWLEILSDTSASLAELKDSNYDVDTVNEISEEKIEKILERLIKANNILKRFETLSNERERETKTKLPIEMQLNINELKHRKEQCITLIKKNNHQVFINFFKNNKGKQWHSKLTMGEVQDKDRWIMQEQHTVLENLIHDHQEQQKWYDQLRQEIGNRII